MEPNPYAPPTVQDPAANPEPRWRLDGSSIIVRNGSFLPRIDLETGKPTDGSRPLALSAKGGGAAHTVLIAALLLVAAGLSLHWGIPEYQTAPFALVSYLLIRRFVMHRAYVGFPCAVWIFPEDSRRIARQKRRRIRSTCLILIALLMVLVPILTPESFTLHSLTLISFFGCSLAAVLTISILAMMDRPRIRIRRENRHSVRISSIHPDALTFLQQKHPPPPPPPQKNPPTKTRHST